MADGSVREQPAYPIGSVDKALRLLTIVARSPQGVRIGDAATTLGVAPSTAHRLLQMLAHHGFARQDPVGKAYLPGEAIRRLAQPRERVIELARPVLAALVEECGETAHLGTLEGARALTMLSVESPHMLRIGDRAGNLQPASLSAMGRVLLAGRSREQVEALFETEGSTGLPEGLHDRLERIAREGVMVQHAQIEPDVSALAVPVRAGSGQAEYAIGITFPTGRVSEEQLPVLIAAARRAAARLESGLRG